MPQRQIQSLPIAFSSFSVCSKEVPATICLVGRRFPQPSSRWAAHSFHLTQCSAEWPPVTLWFYRQACLPSLSVLILFCRCVYSCEPRDHRNKYLLLLSVNEDCQYGGSGRRRKSIKAHSLSLKATRVRFQPSN